MKSIFFIIVFIIFPILLFAQEVGFMSINIGMLRQQALEAAEKNEMIEVPKNRDVEFFPVEDRKILTLSIKPEVPYIYLQFYNDKLYAITVIFDERYIDFYTLSSSLQDKYGKHSELNPVWREWKVDEIIIKVEKPAVVKYIALKEFLEVTSFKGARKPEEYEKRKALLDGL